MPNVVAEDTESRELNLEEELEMMNPLSLNKIVSHQSRNVDNTFDIRDHTTEKSASRGQYEEEDEFFSCSPKFRIDNMHELIQQLENEANRPKEVGRLSPDVPKRWLAEYKKAKED